MPKNVYIENFLKTTDIEKLAQARECVMPLLDKVKHSDVLWLCALCYELGRTDREKRYNYETATENNPSKAAR